MQEDFRIQVLGGRRGRERRITQLEGFGKGWSRQVTER